MKADFTATLDVMTFGHDEMPDHDGGVVAAEPTSATFGFVLPDGTEASITVPLTEEQLRLVQPFGGPRTKLRLSVTVEPL